MDRLLYPRDLSHPDAMWLISNYEKIERSFIPLVDENEHVTIILLTEEEAEKLKSLPKKP